MSKSYCLVSVGNKKSKFLNSSQLFNMKFFVVKDLNRATLHEVVVWHGLIWRASELKVWHIMLVKSTHQGETRQSIWNVWKNIPEARRPHKSRLCVFMQGWGRKINFKESVWAQLIRKQQHCLPATPTMSWVSCSCPCPACGLHEPKRRQLRIPDKYTGGQGIWIHHR